MADTSPHMSSVVLFREKNAVATHDLPNFFSDFITNFLALIWSLSWRLWSKTVTTFILFPVLIPHRSLLESLYIYFVICTALSTAAAYPFSSCSTLSIYPSSGAFYRSNLLDFSLYFSVNFPIADSFTETELTWVNSMQVIVEVLLHCLERTGGWLQIRVRIALPGLQKMNQEFCPRINLKEGMNIITIMAIKKLIVIDVIHIYSTTNWLWKLLQGCWERWHFSKNNTLWNLPCWCSLYQEQIQKIIIPSSAGVRDR